MFATVALLLASTPQLIAYWPGNGNATDLISHEVSRATGGVAYVDSPFGKAFDFGGVLAAVQIPDEPRFKLTDGLTLSCWVQLRSHNVNDNAAQTQILFRGDDRSGLDPYRLSVSNTGNWNFAIDSADNREALLSSPAEVGVWTHLCGTWDGSTGQMCLYVNGELAASQVTKLKPLGDLDQHYHPGLSIGNVQNPIFSSYRQALDGSVAEVKIYNGALAKPDYKPLH